MNCKEAAELSPIIKAFSEGRPIQYRIKDNKSAKWNDVDKNYHKFSPHSFMYRIKPEPKYRPFKDKKECWTEMQKHQPFGWLTSQNGEVNSLIISIDNEGLVIGDRNNGVMGFVTATDLFEIKFADGTPFGVKVEE